MATTTASKGTYQQQQNQQQPTVIDSIKDITNDQNIRIPCWCEENVWRLIYYRTNNNNTISLLNIDSLYVLWISNHIKNVPMLYQRAAENRNDAICYWDYHVILLENRNHSNNNINDNNNDKKQQMKHNNKNDNNNNNNEVCEYYIYDIDTILKPYPISLYQYLQSSFPSREDYRNDNDYNTYQPQFRIISALKYIQYFSSNRLHMYNSIKQTWNAAPPYYQCIGGGSTIRSRIKTNEQQQGQQEQHQQILICKNLKADNNTSTSTTIGMNDIITDDDDSHESNFHHYLNFQGPIELDTNDINNNNINTSTSFIQAIYGIIVSYNELYNNTSTIIQNVTAAATSTN